MTEPVFGITFNRQDDDPRSVIQPDMSTMAFVGTAPEADTDLFPVNTPVLVRTNDTVMRTALGTTGDLPDAIRGVAGQLEEFQSATDVILVRVTAGANDFETIANIIGNEANFTGMWALLLAGPDLTLVPRIVGFPGKTHQRQKQLKGGTIVPGSGGTPGTYPMVFTGGTSTVAATGTITVGPGGGITSFNFTNKGIYTVAPTLNLAGLTGLTGGSIPITLDPFANGIVASAHALLAKLLAHAVVEGPGTTEAEIKDWREDISSDRMIPIDMWVKVQEGVDVATRPGAPRVMGLIAAVDYEHDGVPMHSAANRPIRDIIGFVRTPNFSLTDGANEGQALLLANIGIGVKGELGLESAVANSGFIFIGTDNASEDVLWQFYNVTRGRDFIHIGLLRTLRFFLGRNNITGHVIQQVLNTTRIWLNDLQTDGHILGSDVGFEADKNSPEKLRLGRFRFYFAAEEPPVLRRIDIDSRRYRKALEFMVQDLLAQVQPGSPAI